MRIIPYTPPGTGPLDSARIRRRDARMRTSVFTTRPDRQPCHETPHAVLQQCHRIWPAHDSLNPSVPSARLSQSRRRYQCGRRGGGAYRRGLWPNCRSLGAVPFGASLPANSFRALRPRMDVGSNARRDRLTDRPGRRFRPRSRPRSPGTRAPARSPFWPTSWSATRRSRWSSCPTTRPTRRSKTWPNTFRSSSRASKMACARSPRKSALWDQATLMASRLAERLAACGRRLKRSTRDCR